MTHPVPPADPAKRPQGAAKGGLKSRLKLSMPKPRVKLPPIAPPAFFRRRHVLTVVSFVVMVLFPALITAIYLWGRAVDQYASYVGFSIRQEGVAPALGVLEGLGSLGGSSSSDTDILYEFIQSYALVRAIDADLDLRTIWSKPGYPQDPIFVYPGGGTIEDLVAYWGRMVTVYHDTTTNLLSIRVLAFSPEDANNITQAIFEQSTKRINQLSAIAQEDTLRYARQDLDRALERLKVARQNITVFRNRTQIVDPTVSLTEVTGLLSTLNQQLASALIELDLLRETTRAEDPRIAQAERKIRVIEQRVSEERQKLGLGGGGIQGEALADKISEYERLAVEHEFAEKAYLTAMAGFDTAQAEARRQSRYLAAHIDPTLAERAEYPKRLTLFILSTLFLILIWAVLVLVAYSLKDRR
jgi:capsular polysaccharide transport system permease protein